MKTMRWPAQALHNRAAELTALLRAFNNASWPFLGSGFKLIDDCIRGTDRFLESLCVELARSRGSGAIFADSTQAQPEHDWVTLVQKLSKGIVRLRPAGDSTQPEHDWLARLQRLVDSAGGVARLPQVAALLSELRPKATTVRADCVELIEQFPNAPMPILMAAKTVIIALDRWLDTRPICAELSRLRTECEELRVVAEMMGADEVASRARRAVEALPPIPQEDELELQRKARLQSAAFAAAQVRAVEARAHAERV